MRFPRKVLKSHKCRGCALSLDLALLSLPETIPVSVRDGFHLAEEIHSKKEVAKKLDQLAIRITSQLQDENPIIISILHGGLYLTGQLYGRIVFPFQQGYVHVTRYGDELAGGQLRWIGKDTPKLEGRSVLFIDDVLDEGMTLNHLKDWASSEGAKEVKTVVLSRKIVENQEHVADYVGLESPNKFLFGCGMDLYGYGRNLPSIYGF